MPKKKQKDTIFIVTTPHGDFNHEIGSRPKVGVYVLHLSYNGQTDFVAFQDKFERFRSGLNKIIFIGFEANDNVKAIIEYMKGKRKFVLYNNAKHPSMLRLQLKRLGVDEEMKEKDFEKILQSLK